MFLPFDFSDRYTGWLRVSSVSGGRVVVEAGWSAVAGWSFHPSDIAGTAAGLGDFEPIKNTGVACELGDLVPTVLGIRSASRTPGGPATVVPADTLAAGGPARVIPRPRRLGCAIINPWVRQLS